jgi:hypothetical protein
MHTLTHTYNYRRRSYVTNKKAQNENILNNELKLVVLLFVCLTILFFTF